ncbi:hypothetical protein C8R43DRAFT_502861 [Mycena crocata]|nr:hypothetical protein C8R43DRAFT_502861 [Mycena crocata]
MDAMRTRSNAASADPQEPDPVDLGRSAPTRAEGLWFEDCGLVIQAEETLFRVSRDMLALQSPIFRDMLSLPTPRDAETMDGCPIVRLPDGAEDVTVFLKALFHFDFFDPPPAPTTFPILTGVLRMSHKYEVEALRKRAALHISFFLPTTLRAWDRLDPESWFYELGQSATSYLALIVLARQQSLDWVLPIAFYLTCESVDEDALLGGSADFTMAWDDRVRCMSACRLLETTAVTKMLDFLWSPRKIDGCKSHRVCPDARLEMRRELEASRQRTADTAPRMPLDVWTESGWDDLSVCKSCLSAMKKMHREARQACWNGLPALFGLPEWAELNKMKTDALS